MSTFSVRFQGLLFKSHLEALAKAGVVLKSSETPEIGFGHSIHTAAVEAASAEEAIERVERTLGVDSVNFSDWEAGADQAPDPRPVD
jgi:translation elongation factor EF-1beta